jgi:sec-independent protein translocase protein TatB
MFDFDAGKLLILGVVALVVIGPKELPGVMRQVGQAVAKLRRMAAEFQSQFMEAMREAELDDLKKELASVQEAAKIDIDFNPVEDVKREMTAAVTPPSDNPVIGSDERARQIEPPAPPLALSQPQPASDREATGPGQHDGHSAAPQPHPDPTATSAPANPGTVSPPAASPPAAGTTGQKGPSQALPNPSLPSAGSASRSVEDERAQARPAAAVPSPEGSPSAPPSDSSAKPAKKRSAAPRREVGTAADNPAGRAGDGEPAAAAAPKRKRSAKTMIAEADNSHSAAPESAQTRQRRKSGAP